LRKVFWKLGLGLDFGLECSKSCAEFPVKKVSELQVAVRAARIFVQILIGMRI
jgi:hypothetical protein